MLLVASIRLGLPLLIATAARADELSLDTLPPVVVKTVPESGAGDVDPKLTEIKVSFSKQMQAGAWSWAIVADENFPKLAGQPSCLPDQRTCVLPVKLGPGRTYAL